MDLRYDSVNQEGLKLPVVKLERCDKIWKTLQVIKSMQDKHLEDIENWIKREPINNEKIVSDKPPMTFIPDKSLPLNLIGEPDLPKPYIKYHPVLNNGNEILPQFQLAEKSRVNLYHCELCSKEFCNYKRFANHQNQLHGIILPKRISSKKERLSNKSTDSKDLQYSVDSNRLELKEKIILDENIDLQNAVKTVAKSIKCKLCNRFYRNIKKHVTQYHKIHIVDMADKIIDTNLNSKELYSATQIEPLNTSPGVKTTLDDQKNLEISDKVNSDLTNNTSSVKRKATTPKIEFRKKLRSVRNKTEILKSEFRNGQMKCDICHREFTYYNALCKHRHKHENLREDKQYLEINKNTERFVDSSIRKEADLKNSALAKPMINNKDEDNNIAHQTPETRSRLTKEHDTFADALKDKITVEKDRESKRKKKCSCGRLFRDEYIFFTHKRKCEFVEKEDRVKPTERSTGSNRDSGISIKIKKKNNSYEIVSKEGDKSGGAACEETSDSSMTSSDGSDFENSRESLVSEESKYSTKHRVLKMKFIEKDIDVDIEDKSSRRKMNDTKNGGLVPSLRDLCKLFFIRQGLLPDQETTHRCRFCKAFLGSKEKLSKHIERHKKLMKRSCTCGIKFSFVDLFDNHIMAKHPECITCPYCKEKFKSIVECDEHICIVDQGERYTETFNENYPCPNCNIVFNNITWLDSHLKSEHLHPSLPFQCYQCTEKFPNEIAKSLHFHKMHNQASACTICNQKLQSIKTRQKHEAFHRGVGFPCHKCKKAYQSKSSQLYHVKIVHNEYSNDKLQCFICQKTMKARSFKRHVLRHNSKLECKMCDKVLYNFRNLERHIIDHHRDENYPREKCSNCGISFPTKEQLQVHIAIENSVRIDHKNV